MRLNPGLEWFEALLHDARRHVTQPQLGGVLARDGVEASARSASA